jgi:hypothetical protein
MLSDIINIQFLFSIGILILIGVMFMYFRSRFFEIERYVTSLPTKLMHYISNGTAPPPNPEPDKKNTRAIKSSDNSDSDSEIDSDSDNSDDESVQSNQLNDDDDVDIDDDDESHFDYIGDDNSNCDLDLDLNDDVEIDVEIPPPPLEEHDETGEDMCEDTDNEKGYRRWSVPKLKGLATDRGIDVNPKLKLKKMDIIKLLEDYDMRDNHVPDKEEDVQDIDDYNNIDSDHENESSIQIGGDINDTPGIKIIINSDSSMEDMVQSAEEIMELVMEH